MSGTRTLDQVRQKTAEITGSSSGGALTLDVDMIHVMEHRDERLVTDEILSGSSKSFTYSFNISGKRVEGVSVVGARHLAVKYRKLSHRLVCSISKRGSRQTYITYPAPGIPLQVATQFVDEWSEPYDDFYSVTIEIKDLSSGLTQQTEITESRWEKKSRQGKKPGDPDEYFERPHYERIAQAKAFRNGVIHILPQDVIQEFIAASIATNHNIDLTKDWLEDMRSGVLRFGIAQGIPVNRAALASLDSIQIGALRDAVQNGLEAFKHALAASGCIGSVTPLREIPMGEVVELKQPSPAAPVAETAGPPAPEQVAVQPSAGTTNPHDNPGTGEQQDEPPAVTNQGSSIRRIDLNNPPQALGVWVEMYGYAEARRLGAKQGWNIEDHIAPPEAPAPKAKTPRDLSASMPGGDGPAPIPYEEPKARPAGRQQQGKARRDAPDLFDPREGR